MNVRDMTTTWTPGTYFLYDLPLGTPTNAAQGLLCYPPKDRQMLETALQECIQNGTPFDLELNFVSVGGNHLWVRSIGKASITEGRTTEVFGTFQDITLYKKQELEIKKQKDSLDRIIRNSPGMVYQFVRESTGRSYFAFASPMAFEIFEITEKDFQQNPAIFLEMVHPDDASEIAASIENSAKQMSTFSWIGRIKTKNGTIKWAKVTSFPEQQKNGDILWDGLLVDITAEKNLEHEVLKQRKLSEHQSKLASVGELASGIGHEINNPLTILIGKTERLQTVLSQTKNLTPDLSVLFSEISSAAFRIKNIVEGLRTFARSDEDTCRRPTEIISVVQDLVKLLNDMLQKDGIELSVIADNALFYSQIPEGKLQQILVNLLTNARDALQTCPRNNKKIEISIRSPNKEKIEISVADNGPGIPAHIQQKIFEPFFTTKDVGKGTGIGLSLSMTIASRYDGRLCLVKSDSAGTNFALCLPAITPTHPSLHTAPNNQIEIAKNPSNPELQIRILVVDDEPGIREILRDHFEGFGAFVEEAPDGVQALAALKQKQFHAMVTDIKMPKMNGIDLMKEVHNQFGKVRPRMYVVTGGISETDEKAIRSADGKLNKPFDLQALRALYENIARQIAQQIEYK